MELEEDDRINENYKSMTNKFLPISGSALFQAKTKDREILDKLSSEDEWIEVAKYKQLLYEKDQQLTTQAIRQSKLDIKGFLDG